DHRPGDAWILNDPYRGGTHLPDITLISPIFAPGEAKSSGPFGFAASRAHHADIGGPTPGGMPADSRRLEDEGVVIPPTRVRDEVLARLAAEMRNPPQRLADLRAQRAANLTGERRLLELGRRHGLDVLRAGIADGTHLAEEVMEDDAHGEPRDIHLRVTARIHGDGLTLDFTGTDSQVE